MSRAGAVAMFLGVLIICSRGPLLLAPVSALRWYGEAIKTEARIRVLGVFVVIIGVAMIWSGMPQNSGLEALMFILGVFFLVIGVPGMVMFPRAYMNIADAVLPDDAQDSYFGWRLLGLAGTIIGITLFWFGLAGM